MQSSAKTKALDASGGGFFTWLRFALVFMLICGVLYPFVTTHLGGALFPHRARGSLLDVDGVIVGSEVVGQPFSGEQYFIGRPSAAGDGNDPTSLSGFNWAASNSDLRARAEESSAEIVQREGTSPSEIPVDLIAASGSGVDPHISPAAAQLQAARVARARGLPVGQVQQLIVDATERSPIGLGQPGVNVLRLNIALDSFSAGTEEN